MSTCLSASGGRSTGSCNPRKLHSIFMHLSASFSAVKKKKVPLKMAACNCVGLLAALNQLSFIFCSAHTTTRGKKTLNTNKTKRVRIRKTAATNTTEPACFIPVRALNCCVNPVFRDVCANRHAGSFHLISLFASKCLKEIC